MLKMIYGVKYMQGKHIIPMKPYMEISNPTTMKYHNAPYTIILYCTKTIKKIRSKNWSLHDWSSQNRDISNELTEMSVLQHSANNLPIRNQQCLSKWSCRICRVSKWLKCWKYQNHSKCPRCLKDNEKVDHVICCPHQDSALCWSIGLEGIKEWMIIQHSVPGLALDISNILLHWRNWEEIHPIQRLIWKLQVAIYF